MRAIHSKKNITNKAFQLPIVLLATLYPADPYQRREIENTRAILRDYQGERAFYELRVLVASAHRDSLAAAELLATEFPDISFETLHIETPHAGNRLKEISSCKEAMIFSISSADFDYLLFLDSDVWISSKFISGWIDRLKVEQELAYIQIKYCLRSYLSCHKATLGAYFHTKELLLRTRYWDAIFPNGLRSGAPDCNIYFELKKFGCKRIPASGCISCHFLNNFDAHVYRDGLCFRVENIRDFGALFKT